MIEDEQENEDEDNFPNSEPFFALRATKGRPRTATHGFPHFTGSTSIYNPVIFGASWM